MQNDLIFVKIVVGIFNVRLHPLHISIVNEHSLGSIK